MFAVAAIERSPCDTAVLTTRVRSALLVGGLGVGVNIMVGMLWLILTPDVTVADVLEALEVRLHTS